ncbi:50S ribosomal protein L18 [Candidatus Nomurabacteria bacterium RIFCSPLOWO2_02_40_28]|uniref:Large ribosomal subunit protein uL18 n=3 Tax=Parcubacteria group TaxID=1794811 RepID=A0A0H4T9E3_9BACT|nr:50S ribosomal protein L18, large subunit ribosomal protein L18 [uncultured Parcubacteria bacterium Rifle_16ft_4_minimus_5918]KKR01007.1 MAG: 50S ribosomal protein L18 [Candidatus Nomurabacteria bacterium GW2011_GWD2_39_12]KKR20599.1 MAG: 50S ribosomal protein L18 [Candidatus Nomurabacteria bacterium GW2011_GWC2_39_41]KKR37472.1 MAG: 50S ribosomal protein L18 [Candidatus Nomurabacteria bacterium GW2011_GWE2_40_10]KKR38720.1 MAG: 50S ribosomal protein L18 [Candidatus Nomurabacteria bacterium G
MQKKNEKRIRLKAKIRVKIRGTKERPRLTVFRSNKFIYAQIVDDLTGKTLAEASDIKAKSGTKTARAKEVGQMISEACKAIKVSKVVFDRNGFKYTGRIKLLADEARAGGLQF